MIVVHKKLKIIGYDNYDDFERTYNERFNSTSSYVTELTMFPFSSKTEVRILANKYKIFFVTIPDMLKLYEEIIQNSRELEKIGASLPGVAQNKLIINLLISEIKSTNDIEGVKSSRKEINEAFHSKRKLRFSGIVNLYRALIKSDIIYIEELEDFRKLYDQLVHEEIAESDRPDGELFRKDVVYVTSGNKKVHQGDPNEEVVKENLMKLIDFMNTSDVSFICKAIVTHYYFEYIHPFYDGNGRMGRFLLSIYLARKLDPYTGFSVSQAVLQNKTRYEKAFSEMSHPKNNGEATHFILDLMRIIIDGQKLIRKQMILLIKQLSNAESYIKSKELGDEKSAILHLFFQNHLFEDEQELLSNAQIHEIKKDDKFSRGKVDKCTKELEKEGYLLKVKSKPITYRLSDELMQIVE